MGNGGLVSTPTCLGYLRIYRKKQEGLVWHVPLVPALEGQKQRQEDNSELIASLVYTVSSTQ